MKKNELKGLSLVLAVAGMLLIAWSVIGQAVFIGQVSFNLSSPSGETHYGTQYTGESPPPGPLSTSTLVPLTVKPAWDQKDQYQEKMDTNFAIHKSLENWGGLGWYGQDFYNDGYPMTGFQVLVGWYSGNGNGKVTKPLYLGIIMTNPDKDPSDWAVSGYINANQLQPDTWYWVGIDNLDDYADIPPGGQGPWRAYIMAVSEDKLPDALADGGWWMVGATETDAYTRGCVWNYGEDGGGGWTWNKDYADFDFTFRTYTPQGGQNDKPVVTASSTYWISAAWGGGISLLAALGIAIRYGMAT